MEGPEQCDLAERLPRDVLADVLRRVGAQQRWLAVSRCVCKAWRAVIDREGLLRTDLPFSGLFLSFTWLPLPEFFSRPTSPGQPPVSGKLDFLPSDVDAQSVGYYGGDNDFRIQDHCNGLLLLDRHVVNPATRCWDALPHGPSTHVGGVVLHTFEHEYYLAFDPKVSLHYQVFQIPYLYKCDPSEGASEWPPSPYTLHVFSSRTGRWEERSFVREGDAHGTVSETCESSRSESRLRSVYWRGSLYVHCQCDFVMRISLSEDRYSVIKPQMGVGWDPYLGLSEKGVYLASFVSNHVRVCTLDESRDQAEWILKHDYDLKPIEAFDSQVVHGSWVLEDINYDFFHSRPPQFKKEATTLKDTFERDSDNEDFHDNKDVAEAHHHQCFDIEMLGFHPYKEILFLSRSESYKLNAVGFAYHLNSFKVERLGSIYPTGYEAFDKGVGNDERNIESFPYTPCSWTREIGGAAN